MKFQQFTKNPLTVKGVQVTEENFSEVLAWCDGQRHTDPKGKYIQVQVRHPLNPRQTHAYIGDWVLESERGYKVYPDDKLKASFQAGDIDEEDTPVELMTVDEPVEETENVFEQAKKIMHNHFPTPVDPRNQISGKR